MSIPIITLFNIDNSSSVTESILQFVRKLLSTDEESGAGVDIIITSEGLDSRIQIFVPSTAMSNTQFGSLAGFIASLGYDVHLEYTQNG